MSLSPNEIGSSQTSADYLKNWDQLGAYISQGRSFSGRERNCCFLNLGMDHSDWRFADVSAAANLDDIADCRALAYTDWDHDGDLDLWMTTRSAPSIRFIRNELHSENRFLAIRLEGRSCNRDAIGSRVTVELEQEPSDPTATLIKLAKTLRVGDAFVSQSSKWLHFGIPQGSRIHRVTVQWPGADVSEVVTGCDTNGRFQIIQGSGIASRVDSHRTVSLQPTPWVLPQNTDVARVVLTRRRKTPRLEYLDFHGARQGIVPQNKGPILINLWASWCTPCVGELNDLKAHAATLKEKNLQIYALSTDGVEDSEGRSNLANAVQLARQLALPFPCGVADHKLLATLRVLHSQMFYRDRPLPMPTSFLLDKNGFVVVVYRGPLSADQLLSDIELIDSYDPKRVLPQLYPLGGRSGLDALPTDRFGFAKAYLEAGYDSDAKFELEHYIAQLTSTPDSADRTNRLDAARALLDQIRLPRDLPVAEGAQ